VITGTTRVAAVIGDPIEHSKSPQLHAAAFAALGIDAVMVPLRVSAGALPAAIDGMRALGMLGASVTVPHKQAAAVLCDRLASGAAEIGAVNCLCFAGSEVVGHNTDAPGFVDGLREAGVDPPGLRAVLLGAGGAARAVAAGLAEVGARVSVIARTPTRAKWAADVAPFTPAALAAALPICDLLIDCTSAGLAGDAFPTAVPVDALPAGAVVATLVYGCDTELLRAATARGLQTVDGAGMLVHQAARAFTLWTGQPAPLEAMWRVMGT
jgi:shikimate dehydrogenase